MFLGELEQQTQSWQEVAQREIGQTRVDMVELQGRLTVVESTVQDIQGPQWLTWRAEVAAMVDKQLEGFESRLQQKIGGWTEAAINACEAMEEKLGNMQKQLQEIGGHQEGLSLTQDALCQRVEALELSGLRSILEEQADSLGGRITDSAQFVPQSSTSQMFAKTWEQWEKRGESSSHMMTVLKSPVHGQTEVQDAVEQVQGTPILVARSTARKLKLWSLNTFSGRDRLGKSMPVGGSSMPGRGPGGPPGGGGDQRWAHLERELICNGNGTGTGTEKISSRSWARGPGDWLERALERGRNGQRTGWNGKKTDTAILDPFR